MKGSEIQDRGEMGIPFRGMALFQEDAVKQDAKETKKLAHEGDLVSMRNLALLYLDGDRGVKDLRKAVWWLQKAFEKGDPVSLSFIGKIYRKIHESHPIAPPLAYLSKEIFDWLREESCKEKKAIWLLLSDIYAEGIGVCQSYGKAIDYLDRLEKDEVNRERVRKLWDRWKGVPQDTKSALDWFLSRLQDGNPEMQFRAARLMEKSLQKELRENSEQEQEIFTLYKIAAEKGHFEAQYEVAVRYEYGLVVPKDYAEASKWFKKSAEQGYLPAISRLGWAPFTMISGEFS